MQSQAHFQNISRQCLISLQKYKLKINLLGYNMSHHQYNYYYHLYANQSNKRLQQLVQKISQFTTIFYRNIKYAEACQLRVVNNCLHHYNQKINNKQIQNKFLKQQEEINKLIVSGKKDKWNIIETIKKKIDEDLQRQQHSNCQNQQNLNKLRQPEIFNIIDSAAVKSYKQYDNFERSIYNIVYQMQSHFQKFNKYLNTWSNLCIDKINNYQLYQNHTPPEIQINHISQSQRQKKQNVRKKGILKNKPKQVYLADWHINYKNQQILNSFINNQIKKQKIETQIKSKNVGSVFPQLLTETFSNAQVRLTQKKILVKQVQKVLLKQQQKKKQSIKQKMIEREKYENQNSSQKKIQTSEILMENKIVKNVAKAQRVEVQSKQKPNYNQKIKKQLNLKQIPSIVQVYFQEFSRKTKRNETDPYCKKIQFHYLSNYQNISNQDLIQLMSNTKVILLTENIIIECQKYSTLRTQGKIVCNVVMLNIMCPIEQKMKEVFKNSNVKFNNLRLNCSEDDRKWLIIGIVNELSNQKEISQLNIEKYKKIGQRIFKDVEDYLTINN